MFLLIRQTKFKMLKLEDKEFPLKKEEFKIKRGDSLEISSLSLSLSLSLIKCSCLFLIHFGMMTTCFAGKLNLTECSTVVDGVKRNLFFAFHSHVLLLVEQHAQKPNLGIVHLLLSVRHQEVISC